jgi:hypothetical protein
MVNSRSFGRRAGPQPRLAKADVEVPTRGAIVSRGEACIERPQPPPTEPQTPSLDEELREWKQARKSGFRIPWRQLSLMASLCFGMASLVLPASVNDNVQWLLYGLMAVSLYTGFSGRFRKAKSSVSR